MTEAMDPVLTMMVELKAAFRAEERIPKKGAHRLADFLTIDDYRHGIRFVFSEGLEQGEFEEWMVSPLLRSSARSSCRRRLRASRPTS